MKNPRIAAIALGLASCGAPKAIVVSEAPTKAPETENPAAEEPQTPIASAPDDGLRLGDDILALPKDEELQSSKPSGDGDATIIARPPEE